ncbi:ER lumen protein-retaining receptor-like isoform X1 [Cucurbita maxima]|uniref:ER lumen protein-retaining receptor n=1 Tax=Cucurbita maxima TaxID=3661 RepID=A0A6J1HUR5_CUCMA|nr:ER lumen protein-retaining receptor-like isoform X1 [Cucurbita maxima]
MNIFRLAGDMTHLASVLVLLLKIHTIKSCAGVSLKTQELYAIVFTTRYLDIFTDFISLYNTFMKLIFLGSSYSIVWYIRRHKIVRRSYDKNQDTFRHVFLILPCIVLALLINEKLTFKEVLWAFSLYLEAVAILPQLVLLQRTKNIDNLTGQYVFLLGVYRALYIVNWIYRYFTETHFVHWISNLDFRACANATLRRLLLLLFSELEDQPETPVASLRSRKDIYKGEVTFTLMLYSRA